jgi:hypothetical protein
MRGSVSIPATEYSKFPVDVYIRIKRLGPQYTIEIRAHGQVFPPTPIELSPDDLVLLNRDFQSALEDVASCSVEGEDSIPEEFRKQLLSRLAELGNSAFTRFLGDGDARRVIEDLLALDHTLSIQLASEDFSLPWELMYPANPRAVNLRAFLGHETHRLSLDCAAAASRSACLAHH